MPEAFFKLSRFGKSKIDFQTAVAFFGTACFVIGYAVAVVIVTNGNGSVFSWAESALDGILSKRGEISFLMLALGSFAEFFPFLLATFLFGTAIVGAAVVPACGVMFGFMNGAVIGALYFKYNIGGIGFAALVLAPALVLKAYTLILSLRESICFSRNVLKNSLPHGTADNLSAPFRVYCIRYIFIIIFAIAAAVTDAASAAIFFGYFSL